jgi:hypothetical protein
LVFLIGIILEIEGVNSFKKEGGKIIIDCNKAVISHSALNVRSLFNHYSNLTDLEPESKYFILDLSQDNYEEE